MNTPLLQVRGLSVDYRVPGRTLLGRSRILAAVSDVSFDLQRGETLGIVGESGCGKSSLARGILGLVPLASGEVRLDGRPLTGLSARELRKRRHEAQMIFQDPLAALDPRMTIGAAVAEPLRVFRPDLDRPGRRRLVAEMLERVGLSQQLVNRYPHEFSGGQCQRIGIARALISMPAMIVCDEAVSALDVSVQAQIINLLTELQRDLGLSLIFIAHDLSVVRHVSRRIMVMYLGRVMETGDSEGVCASPLHPYTRALIDAVPVPEPGQETQPRTVVSGELPSALNPPSGCVFRTRCPLRDRICTERQPEFQPFGQRFAACHFAGQPSRPAAVND